jgi:hypothetical protein
MREVDGKKVAFVDWETYTSSMFSPSMYSTARDTGADIVFLLAPGATEANLSDDEIRGLLQAAQGASM